MILHILERGAIHFIAAAALVLMVFFTLRYWIKHNRNVKLWISPEYRHLLVVSGLCVWALSTLREPIDVALGQPWYKAITDFISWQLGCGTAVWGLHRFKKEN